MRDGQLLGRIEKKGVDQPFFYGPFEATPAFDDVRPLFEEELRLLHGPEDPFDGDAWSDAFDRILGAGVYLVLDDGTEVREFIFHVQGSFAWYRY
jgi:hypothetical protein